ncbi:hypothetical protein [Flavobacterium pectinovorum]|uniref:Uncharacterized protein n=1 Tax=Flavobacterium pectinovorum TaxID=29533 RepID=A0A502EAP6_9FLAO|nr:hypothetical protein [Flavobacterium pectinovorum]TPG34002.1 hypothetical protein EAH81_22625 [Flavobacterium pectinovorum]
MKKVLLIAAVFVILILIFMNSILGKFLTGTARIIGKEIKSEIYIDGKREDKAKLFISKSNFEGNETRDYLILYLRDVKKIKEYPVLVIDRKYNDVMIPNASKNDYNLVFNYLFQSDSGANVMVFVKDDVKGLGFEPDLRIENNVIKFKMLFAKKPSDIIIKIR